MKDIYVSPKVLDWHTRWADWDSEFPEDLDRPYQIFLHAEKLLEMGHDSHFRGDCVISLNRAVSRRTEQLNLIYKLKKIPFYSKKDGVFEILSDLGFIRPRMLREIRGIRNSVEHQDASPPNDGRCREFCEFVWYFLRTTDQFLTGRPELMEYSESEKLDSAYSLNWQLQFGSELNILVRGGCIPKEYWSFAEISGWIKISNAKWELKPPRVKECFKKKKGGLESSLFIRGGSLASPQVIINRMIRDYFSAVIKGLAA